jgi:hypothetical protein
MEDKADLTKQIANARHCIDELVWSITTDFSSLLLAKGHKKDDLDTVAVEFNKMYKMGKITVRKKAQRAAKPKVDGKNGKETDGNNKRGKDKIKRYDDIVQKVRVKQNNLTWKLLSDEMGEDAVPESLIGIYYCDNEVLGLDDDESLTASKSENKYKAEWIINSDVNRRYLTTDEAEHFRLFGIIVNNDSINDKDQAFYVANF